MNTSALIQLLVLRVGYLPKMCNVGNVCGKQGICGNCCDIGFKTEEFLLFVNALSLAIESFNDLDMPANEP